MSLLAKLVGLVVDSTGGTGTVSQGSSEGVLNGTRRIILIPIFLRLVKR